jgi:large subunit ribosomal protein L3
MTHMFDENGAVIPLTAIQVGPCPIVQVKRQDGDGYTAYQMGFGEIKEKNVNKPQQGHFKKAGVQPTRYLREVRCSEEELPEVGATLSVEEFADVQFVDVTGTSKGKGFAGGMKRHGFGGYRRTHGQMGNRIPGSIGSSAFPSRLFPGKRMAGHMGYETITALGLRIAKVDAENHVLYVKGSVPGPNGRLVEIRASNRGKAKKANKG